LPKLPERGAKNRIENMSMQDKLLEEQFSNVNESFKNHSYEVPKPHQIIEDHQEDDIFSRFDVS